MQRIDGKFIYVKIPKELLKEVDRVAKRAKLTRSEMVRNLLDVGTDLFRTYEAVGVIKMIEFTESLKKTVKRSVGQPLFKALK